jgi:hypothetical protein
LTEGENAMNHTTTRRKTQLRHQRQENRSTEMKRISDQNIVLTFAWIGVAFAVIMLADMYFTFK